MHIARLSSAEQIETFKHNKQTLCADREIIHFPCAAYDLHNIKPRETDKINIKVCARARVWFTVYGRQS